MEQAYIILPTWLVYILAIYFAVETLINIYNVVATIIHNILEKKIIEEENKLWEQMHKQSSRETKEPAHRYAERMLKERSSDELYDICLAKIIRAKQENNESDEDYYTSVIDYINEMK